VARIRGCLSRLVLKTGSIHHPIRVSRIFFVQDIRAAAETLAISSFLRTVFTIFKLYGKSKCYNGEVFAHLDLEN